jgi:hypothetical protein
MIVPAILIGYELLLKLKVEELMEQRFMEGEGEGEAGKRDTACSGRTATSRPTATR